MEYYFPFTELRKFQKEFMDGVYDALLEKKNLLVHAPTGVGKTVSVLAPVLKFAAEQKKVVFFLTTRNSQHMIAVETLKAIKEKFGIGAVVDLIGKKKMCSQSGIDMLTSGEFAEYCRHLKEKDECEFYLGMKKNGKLSTGVQSTLDKLKGFSPQLVMDFKESCQGYCPHEMAMLMSKDAIAVVADYNYMLNPMIRKNFLLRMGKKMEDCIVVFDEAHNLPSRARDEMSASLSSRVVVWAAKECKDFGHKDVETVLMNLHHKIEGLGRDKIKDKYEAFLLKEDLNFEGYEQLVGSLNFISEEVLEKKRKSFCASVANFLEFWRGRNDGFVRILKKEKDKMGKWFLKVVYNCLSPSFLLKDLVDETYSVIGMSGTMNPLPMYVDLLGFNDYKLLEFQSPFPSENRVNIVVPRTSTKFKLRGEKMYEEIASIAADVTNRVEGNVAVFFPSYYLRDEIYKYYMDKSEKTILLEENSLRSVQLFEKFSSYKDTGAVLLGVLGGSFSEGIDFCGDLLKGVVVVGLPLAPPDLETRELITYYDRMYSKGWDYGYVIPALIKSIQSAGRCIRSSTDKGVIVFLDERYTWRNYYECFPKDWKMVIDRDPGKRVKDFFENIIK